MSKEQRERKLKQVQKMTLSEAFGVRASGTSSTILEAASEGMPSSSVRNQGKVEDMVDEEAYPLPGTRMGSIQG